MYTQLTPASITQKSVILRLDLDVPLRDGRVLDDTRLVASLPTLHLCLKHAKNTLIIGHLGRPANSSDTKFSLKPVHETLKRLLDQDISMIESLEGVEKWGSSSSTIALLENTRFFSGEQDNDPEFVIKLAQNRDIFINDSFATSHREVASVVGLPTQLPTVIGPSFHKEITALRPIIDNPKHPITLILGGAKADKLHFVDNFVKLYDTLLIGGALVHEATSHEKIVPATLTNDGLDITIESAQHFSRLIGGSATIIWNGPMGKFEDVSHAEGTRLVAQAITSSPALKIAGGADTIAAITQLDLADKFDHISLGGGAMLYYLAHRSLPALQAISNSKFS